jgi:protein kinase-like protein
VNDVIGGRYEIRRKLGSGGMASVYLAHDPLLSRDVAIKIPRLDGDVDEDRLERFRSELRAIGRLNHPNVVTIYDGGQDEGTPFLVMEPVDGENLAQLIRREAPLPADRAVAIARQIAEALSYAHEQGIVHRDVKPQNVLLDRTGRAKVTDFGIAKSSEMTRTLTGTILGTPSFMAPEVAGGEPVTPAADIYGLGAVLYQMLTGHTPFEAVNPIAAAVRSQREDAQPPSRLAPVPAWLDGVVLRALARDPAQRYASAAALAEDLAAGGERSPWQRRAEAETSGLETTLRWQRPAGRRADEAVASYRREAPPRGGTPREPRPKRRVPLIAWLLPLLVLLVVGGGLGFAAKDAPRQAGPSPTAGPARKAPSASAGVNLLANGGLLTSGAQPADWRLQVFQGGEPVRHWAPGGPASGDREITLESASGTDSAWISNEAKVEAGRTLTLSGWIQTRGVPADGPGAALWLVCLDAGGKETGQANSQAIRGSAGWTEVQARGAVPAGTAGCSAQLRLGAPGKPTTGIAEFSRIALVAS